MRELWDRWEMLCVLAIYATRSKSNQFSKKEMEWLSGVMRKRSMGSIKLRLANYIARDQSMVEIGLKGMTGGGDFVDLIWQEISDTNGYLDKDKLIIALSRELAILKKDVL